MRRRRMLLAFLACVFLTPSLHADCTGDLDNRSNKASGVLIANFTINLTRTLSSAELARITGEMAGYCFDENSEELQERVRALFQDRG